MEDFSSSAIISCKDLFCSASALAVLNLDFSRKGLKEFPDNPPICPKLECLYLEGNQLSAIPSNLPILYPSLCWLDLRHNSIASLPTTICKLRNLKTLLLEGNQLSSLPPQLGLLQLDGLSLSGNPLQSPPSGIIEKGTKVVLQYLRRLLNPDGDSGTEGSSSEEDEGGIDSAPPSRLNIVRRSRTEYGGSSRSKGLFLKPATLHSSLDQQKRKQEHIANLLLSMEKLKKSNRIKTRKGSHKKSSLPMFGESPKLKQKEKEKITEELDRKKSQQYLSDWREEAKKKQQRQQDNCSNIAPPTAPYATEEESVKKAIRLPSSTQVESNACGTISEWTKEYVRQHLVSDRSVKDKSNNNTGDSDDDNTHDKLLLSKTSSNDMADYPKRQYRLRAFTGDTVYF